MDYSFLRLKDTLQDALNMQDSPVVTHYDLSFIQLLPSKSYLQITNYPDGISLDSDCEVFVVDCNNNVLADITSSVFIEEFTDSNGKNQCKIEYVNLNVDFYRNTVLIRFSPLSSNINYWTNPVNITDYQKERTVYFQYKNYDDFNGIGYTNANAWQSISLQMYFDIPDDQTETENYFQISKENTISTRALRRLFEQYTIEKINRFGFDRLNLLLKHELIYIDCVRVTDKPTVSSGERLGDTNYFETDFLASKDYSDTRQYEFQVFQGFVPTRFAPVGSLLTGTSFNYIMFFNVDITINEGTIKVYDSSNTLISTYTEEQMLFDTDEKTLVVIPSATLADGDYYVNVSAGLYSFNGIPSEAINDSTTWAFSLGAADFLGTDFNNNDFFTD